MSKIVKVEEEIQRLSALFDRWKNEKLDNVAMYHLVQQSSRKLGKINQICFCDEGVCCVVHKEHVTPHQGCILR